jgi:hypothetical protein
VSPEICRVCGGPEDDAAVVALLAPGRVSVRWANGTEAEISAPRPREYAPAVAPSITVRRQEQP